MLKKELKMREIMNQLKSLFFVMFASLTAASSYAAHSFTGIAENWGELYLGCSYIEQPSPADAHADSERQAADFCDTFNLKPIRISDFTYDEDCLPMGSGFSKAYVKTLKATALYRCL